VARCFTNIKVENESKCWWEEYLKTEDRKEERGYNFEGVLSE